MTGVHLLTLPRHLIEKIMSKVEAKSNFRLRQTCHDVNELIQTSRSISVFVYERFSIEPDETSCSFTLLHNPEEPIDIVAVCATRVDVLILRYIRGEEMLESLCEFLKKWKITCERLRFNEATESYPLLLKALKPTVLYLDNEGDDFTVDGFELPANSNFYTVKDITAGLSKDDAVVLFEKHLPFFTKATEVSIRASKSGTPCASTLLRTVLKNLLSRPWPELETFDFSVYEDDKTSVDELKQEFPGMEWTHIIENDMTENFTAEVELPPHFSQEACCKIFILNHTFARTSFLPSYSTYIIYYASDSEEMTRLIQR